MLHSPLYEQALDYSAMEDRQIVNAIGDPGVCGVPDLAVTQRAAGANMTVDVASGRCIIGGLNGHYLCASDAVTSVAIDAAPGVGNERIDLVWARLEDSEITGTNNQWTIGKTTGTPAGTPSVPALPSAYAIPLAEVRLTSSTTSVTDAIITNARYQSAPPALKTWPRLASNNLGEQTVGGTNTLWGSPLVFSAPNRPVKIQASLSGRFFCASGNVNVIGQVALRVAYGSTTLTPGGVSGLSPTDLHGIPISRVTYQAFTPGRGENITISAYIMTAGGTGSATFDSGILIASMFPA